MQNIIPKIMQYYSTPIRDIYNDAYFPLPSRLGKIAVLPNNTLINHPRHLFVHSYCYCPNCGEYKKIKTTYPIDLIENQRKYQLITQNEYLWRITLFIRILNDTPCQCLVI